MLDCLAGEYLTEIYPDYKMVNGQTLAAVGGLAQDGASVKEMKRAVARFPVLGEDYVRLANAFARADDCGSSEWGSFMDEGSLLLRRKAAVMKGITWGGLIDGENQWNIEELGYITGDEGDLMRRMNTFIDGL